MLQNLSGFLFSLNHVISLCIVFPLLFIIGIYFTIRLRGIQLTKARLGWKYLTKKEDKSEGNISHFEAVSAVLAGNLGTGNISGVAVALVMGGPGAIFWMWIMAFLGAIIKYAGCFLGIKYRTKNQDNEYCGGPMYYISKGLGRKKMACLFSVLAIVTAFTVGNFVQVNSIMLPLKSIGVSPLMLSLSLMLLVGVVILGGMKRIAKVVGAVVPMMTVLYLGFSLLILFFYLPQLGSALKLIITNAFSISSVFGGGLGYSLLTVMQVGMSRGIFATDAGLGIAPVLQSSARTKSPIVEGLVAMVAPIVVMVVCTVTALVLIVTGAWMQGLESTDVCTFAFVKGIGSNWAAYIVLFSLFMFAFTTILAWSFCAEKAIEFLAGKKWVQIFQYAFIASIPIGAFMHVSSIWALADLSISFMLIVNVTGIFLLSKDVIGESRAYFASTVDSS